MSKSIGIYTVGVKIVTINIQFVFLLQITLLTF